MDSDLTCNLKKCRKPLTSFAWVTSCSHIFCDEDGTKEFNKSYACPACEQNLSGKFDIIRTDLSPTDQYKSMVLAGQKPEVIMEICTRALSFWTYQAHQERTYHEYLSNKSKERCLKLEQYYEQVLARLQNEISSLKSQVSTAKHELEALKARYNECSSKLVERNRHYQKLQSMYDVMRRRTVTTSTFGSSDDLGTRLKPSLAPHFSLLPSRNKGFSSAGHTQQAGVHAVAVAHSNSGAATTSLVESTDGSSSHRAGQEGEFEFRPQVDVQQSNQFSTFRLPTPPAGRLGTPQVMGTAGTAVDTEASASTSADMQAKFTLNLSMPGPQIGDVIEPKRFQ
ncbi:E3 ubiquitin-protein ligase CCNB1IP1-like isoform X1 [Sycon ciliatum]|uniref:E3 ubiquitin-protein ligase CCNB1IP1-like isoform X1 n=1 Tax=Sycon ciliatum TaxID=27933 RepID=UPI0020AEA77F